MKNPFQLWYKRNPLKKKLKKRPGKILEFDYVFIVATLITMFYTFTKAVFTCIFNSGDFLKLYLLDPAMKFYFGLADTTYNETNSEF